MHATGSKGDIGVARATATLIEQGWTVLMPVASTSPFDLVAYRDGVFRKVQVKYRSSAKGVIAANLRRAVVARGKASYRPMTKDDVDTLCFYCPETKECYFVPCSEIDRCCQLRITPSKNPGAAVRMASDYIELR